MEKPILFSAPMVRAILEGRKTQTRRVCKHQSGSFNATQRLQHSRIDPAYKCPYGQPGDHLWVRETWQIIDNPIKNHIEVWYPNSGPTEYIVCGVGEKDREKYFGDNFCPRRRPSIHMPRWASRIDLIIKDVRVERLQDISEEDAMSEGIEGDGNGHYKNYLNNENDTEFGMWLGPKISFCSLWDSINGKPHKTLGDISWKANPWVWVVEFERVRP